MAKRPTRGTLEGLAEEDAWLDKAQAFGGYLRDRFDALHSEVCVGANFLNGEARFFPDVKDRGYPTDMPGWVFGTMDVLAFSFVAGEIAELYVGDWKTGGTDGADEQLLSLLAATVRAFGLQDTREPVKLSIAVLEVTQDAVYPTERPVTMEELNHHWTAMTFQLEALSKAKSPVAGIHCTTLYCGHLAHCPAIAEVVETAYRMDGILDQEALLKKLVDNPVDNEEAAGSIELVTAAKRQITYLTECMKDWVRNNGPIVSGSWTWGPGKDGFRWRKRKAS